MITGITGMAVMFLTCGLCQFFVLTMFWSLVL